MKKTLARTTLLMVVLSIFMSLFAGLAVAESAYVQTSGNVNVRAGAGLEYRSLGTVDKDARLTYLEDSRKDDRGVTWYYVRYNSSTNGWISSKYCKLMNYDQKVVANNGQTYIRDEGSLYGKKLGILPKGASATYLNSSDVDDRGVTWYRVSYDGVKGWVSSRYTKLQSSASYTQKVVATGGKTNVRSSGNLDAEVLTSMPKGASATYLEQSMKDERGVTWYRVNYNGTKGWVSSKYTTLGSGSSTPSVTRKVVATDGKTYVRSSGNLDAEILTSMPRDASATYLDQKSTDERGVVWYRVNYNGTKGWVSSKYTTLK